MARTTCEKCKEKECLKTGKPCDEIERIMRREGVYSASYIRPKLPSEDRKRWGEWREIPFSSLHYNEDKGTFNDPFPKK